MTTWQEDDKFAVDVCGGILEKVIEWLNDDFEPEQVFEDTKLKVWANDNIDRLDGDKLREWALKNMEVSEFSELEMGEWAENNGYKKAGE